MITARKCSENCTPVHIAKYGGYGKLPPNFREITEKEFAQSKMFVYSPEFEEFRQINDPEAVKRFKWGELGRERSCVFDMRMLYFYDGTGVAMVGDYWAGRVRYFSFAVCEHKNKTEEEIGNCLHTYTCTECGFKETIDSSD